MSSSERSIAADIVHDFTRFRWRRAAFVHEVTQHISSGLFESVASIRHYRI
jgi:hypothetical protein